MNQTGRQIRHVWVVIFTAYALLLQSLFPVFAASSNDSFRFIPAVICGSDQSPSDPDGHATSHENCCVFCASPALPAGSGANLPLLNRAAMVPAVIPARDFENLRPGAPEPLNPRGPPRLV